MDENSDDDVKGPFYHHFKKQTLKYKKSRRSVKVDDENPNSDSEIVCDNNSEEEGTEEVTLEEQNEMQEKDGNDEEVEDIDDNDEILNNEDEKFDCAITEGIDSTETAHDGRNSDNEDQENETIDRGHDGIVHLDNTNVLLEENSHDEDEDKHEVTEALNSSVNPNTVAVVIDAEGSNFEENASEVDDADNNEDVNNDTDEITEMTDNDEEIKVALTEEEPAIDNDNSNSPENIRLFHVSADGNSFLSELQKKFSQMNFAKAEESGHNRDTQSPDTFHDINEDSIKSTTLITRSISANSEIFYDATEDIPVDADAENHIEDRTRSEDETPSADRFNSEFRYVLRHSKKQKTSVTNSNNGNETHNGGGDEGNETHDDDGDGNTATHDGGGDGGSLTASSLAAILLRADHISAVTSEHGTHIVQDQENSYYWKFEFVDPMEDLNKITRTSLCSDGVMSSPQQEFEENPHEDDKKETSEWAPIEHGVENLRINKRALPQHVTTYQLEKFEKNALIIFNQENVDGYNETRRGTRQDGTALINTFSKYNFEVAEHMDLTKDELFEELQKFSQTDFTDYGCVAVAILTHGSDLGSLRAKDRRYYETDVIKYFKTAANPTLVTKPKIIIIQACRGSKETHAFHVNRSQFVSRDHDDDDVIPQTYTLPMESDILILHSTFAGKTSHRDEIRGTWFIQTLCEKINLLADVLDLESIVTEVKRAVATEQCLEIYNRRTQNIQVTKQMPVISSTLIRKLYLKKKSVENDSPDCVRKETIDPPQFLTNLERFEYLKRCIAHFVEDNQDDSVAKSLLEMAEAAGEGIEYDAMKENMSKVITNYLTTTTQGPDAYKYIFLKNKE